MGNIITSLRLKTTGKTKKAGSYRKLVRPTFQAITLKVFVGLVDTDLIKILTSLTKVVP